MDEISLLIQICQLAVLVYIAKKELTPFIASTPAQVVQKTKAWTSGGSVKLKPKAFDDEELYRKERENV